MGQKSSRDAVHSVPELTLSAKESSSVVRKAGSLSTLHGRLGTHKIRRTRSLTEHDVDDEHFRQRLLKQRVDHEAAALNQWVLGQTWVSYVPTLTELASIAVAKCLRTQNDVERLPLPRPLKEAVEFMIRPVLDESIADGNVVYSNSGRTIVYKGKSYSTSVMKTPLDKGLRNLRHAWLFYVDTSRVQGWIQIGIVNKERWNNHCKTEWDSNPHPFRPGEMARRSNGNFHSGLKASEASIAHESIFLGGYTSGDTIGIKLDFSTGKIQWTRNGHDYGSVVKCRWSPVWPSVSLDSPGECVSLVYYTNTIRSKLFAHCS